MDFPAVCPELDRLIHRALGQRSQNIRTSVTSDIVQIIVTVKGHLLACANGKVNPLDDIVRRSARDARDAHRRPFAVQYRICLRYRQNTERLGNQPHTNRRY